MKEQRLERLARVDDYVRGEMPEAEVDGFEDDLFARALAGEAPELAAYHSLVASLRDIAERGTLMTYITALDATKMRERYGDRLVYFDLPNDGTTHLDIPKDAELFLTRVALDVQDAERIDVEIAVEGVGPIKVMPDITFEREEGAIYIACEGDLARMTVNMPVRTRYWGHTPSGRKLLADTLTYTKVV